MPFRIEKNSIAINANIAFSYYAVAIHGRFICDTGILVFRPTDAQSGVIAIFLGAKCDRETLKIFLETFSHV